jgi:hypothetical protein
MLECHDAHKKELVAIVQRARSINLAPVSWANTLLDLF